MTSRFEGKVLVITGAAQGIGRCVAERAIAEGGSVALIDRSELVFDLREALPENRCKAFIADMEQYGECQTAIASAHRHFGTVDVLINNVGGTIWTKPFEHYKVEEIEAEIRRSLLPTLWGCHAVLPYMIAQGQGSIVNVSSIATRGINRVPYGASKGGVNALTACLAFENAERGIRVNAVATGGTEAPPRRVPRNSQPPSEDDQRWYQQIVDQTVATTLMKRYGTLDEQAAAILFLASDEASYITGTVVPVGGGDLG